jgi:hypothetical protein
MIADDAWKRIGPKLFGGIIRGLPHGSVLANMKDATLKTTTTTVRPSSEYTIPNVDSGSKAPLIWHYTRGERFVQILESGYIRPSIEELQIRPAVCFSTEQFWEPTVFVLDTVTGKYLGMQEMLDLGISLVRIGVLPEVAPLKWADFRRQSGICQRDMQYRIKICMARGGHTSRWRVTFDNVPLEQWAAVQVFDVERDEWRDLTEALEAQQGAANLPS